MTTGRLIDNLLEHGPRHGLWLERVMLIDPHGTGDWLTIMFECQPPTAARAVADLRYAWRVTRREVGEMADRDVARKLVVLSGEVAESRRPTTASCPAASSAPPSTPPTP